jgi:hypothetical protein
MATMSIRGLDEQVLTQLKRRATQEGSSLNNLVLRLLQGSDKPVQPKVIETYDDLDALAGTWSDEEGAAFAQNTAVFAELDPAQWQ